MRNIPTKVDAVDDLNAAEFNSDQDELENIVTSADITLDPGAGPDVDLEMLGKAVSGYANAGWGYTDSGTANAHVLSIASNLKSPTKYYDNMIVAYIPGNTNTSTTVTVNVATLGNKNIREIGGGLPVAGRFSNSYAAVLKYNDGAGYFEIVNFEDNQFTTGSFTRDLTLASGTQAVTGVGFSPRALFFTGIISATGELCWGKANDPSSEFVVWQTSGAGGVQSLPNASIFYDRGSTNTYKGELNSLDADGFTINWTKQNSPTGIGLTYFFALR